MAKKGKLSTPAWITEGYDSPAEYEKAMGKKSGGSKKIGKTFKVRRCPECKSDEVKLVLSNSDSEQGGGKDWECSKCKWVGPQVNEDELTEDEFMKYLDEKGEEVQ
jgi:hypothetical protein